MFRWLKSRRERRRLAGRGLFRYSDGKRWRYADPFLIYRRLQNHETVDFEATAPLVDAGQEPDATQFVVALAEVFGVDRWDDATQTGLTDWEIIDLLNQLWAFLELLKKSTSTGLTQSQPTDSESSTFEEPPPETTSASSDSGKTPSESTSGEPSTH